MKILIADLNLYMGGVATSLLNFISNMKDFAEIDVLLLNKSGELLEKIPSFINVMEGPKDLKHYGIVRPVKHNILKKGIIKILKVFGGLNIRDYLKYKSYKKVGDWSLDKKYDLAISFNGFEYVCNSLVLNNIDAKVKICIAHNDITKYKQSRLIIKQFAKFDRVCGCSQDCADTIKKKYKELSNVDYLYNFQNIEKIMENKNESCESIKRENSLCIGIVGRLSKQKAPMRLMRIINNLNKKNYVFDFYWIGDGELRLKVEQYLIKHKVSNVHLLGNQINPYKYLKQLDLFVLYSLHEGAPMVYAEAMSLGIPILTADTCSAQEMVGNWGWVCKNDKKSFERQMEYLLQNQNEIEIKKKNLKLYKWDNTRIVNKILELTKKNDKNTKY